MEKNFRLHWRTGKPEDVKGNDIAQAMTNAGYGAGALPALDYWEEIKLPKTKHDIQRPEC